MIEISEIAPPFSFILEKGLVPNGGRYSGDAFGNAVLLVVGTQFLLRFRRDRGEVFVDVGTNSGWWGKLEDVLEFVGASELKDLGKPPDLTKLATLLRMNWDSIANVIKDEARAAQLKSFTQQKAAALMTSLFPKA